MTPSSPPPSRPRRAARAGARGVRLASLREIPAELDVIRALAFRPERFGRPFGELAQQVMRGPSDWSPGERELFAAFVSAQNQCPF